MSDNWQQERLEHWLTKAWADALELVFSSLSDPDMPAIAVTPAQPVPALWAEWKEPLWLEVESNIADGASMRIGCVGATASEIARRLEIDPDDDPAGAMSTYLEVINQTAGGTADPASESIGHQVVFQAAASAGVPRNTEDAVEFRFELQGATHSIALAPNPTLAKVLSGENESAPAVSEPESKPTATPAATESRAELPPNIAVLMDVELDLAVSFGSTVMPLEEVLQLGSGAIVELNRSASDPVDLLVNNSVIARGEVVVVDGNYGVKITKVMSPRERIEKLL